MNPDRNITLIELNLHIKRIIEELKEVYFEYITILEEEENDCENCPEETWLSKKGLAEEEILNTLMEEAGSLFNIINNLREVNINIDETFN